MSKTEQQEGMSTWRKSTYSINNGACTEVAAIPGAVLVRDSVSQSGIQLSFLSGAWQTFIAHLKAV